MSQKIVRAFFFKNFLHCYHHRFYTTSPPPIYRSIHISIPSSSSSLHSKISQVVFTFNHLCFSLALQSPSWGIASFILLRSLCYRTCLIKEYLDVFDKIGRIFLKDDEGQQKALLPASRNNYQDEKRR